MISKWSPVSSVGWPQFLSEVRQVYGYIVVDLFHFEPDLVILEKNVLIFIEFPTDGKGHLFCGRRGHLEFWLRCPKCTVVLRSLRSDPWKNCTFFLIKFLGAGRRTIIVHVIYLVYAINEWFWRRKHWNRILLIENQSYILLNSGWISIWIIL